MPYTAVVLTQDSHAALMSAFPCPDDFIVKGHHMTIDLKPAEKSMAAGLIGNTVQMTVVSVGHGDGIMAVKVETDAPSKNEIKHITLGHRPEVKPKESNNITEWTPVVETIELFGVVQQVD